jgi:hypothetical protein
MWRCFFTNKFAIVVSKPYFNYIGEAKKSYFTLRRSKMQSHKYILRDSDVGDLATSVALQDGDVSLCKDNKSSFYIATVMGHGITVPENIAALEMQAEVEKPPKGIEMNEDSMDLMVRLHFRRAIKSENLSIIYEEIAKAVDVAIEKIDNPGET